ncbi:hypothetical protein KC343_g4769 [Hortaea werneckii]|nr:hypothetical protein KC343_g4769 [Hortaea werneckii]KAI7677548.1 hypothetical protein KC319_g3844 [Hortaea werneckii]
MDKFKGLAKGGWHPAGDRGISRDSWRSDLKGIATGKKEEDPHSYQARRDHQSAPLSSLRDPSSFGAPPKHTGAYGSGGGATGFSTPGRPGGGGPVPTPSRRLQQPVEEEPPKPPEPYRMDTSGLKTDHLPKPPAERHHRPYPQGPHHQKSHPDRHLPYHREPPPLPPSHHPHSLPA